MKIAIDLGHGVGKDRGSVGIITEESIINEVGVLVINKLKTLGHEVIEVRPTSCSSVQNSLAQRVNKANSNNVDLFVSIHANATIGGYGTEIYTYNGNKFDKAENILKNLVDLGFRDRGIKPSNNVAYVVNHTNAKAMLIETLFVDSQSDVELYNKLGANKVADAIVKGLVGVTTQTTNNSKPASIINTNNNTNKISTHLRDLQQAVNLDGYAKIQVDGLYGSETDGALRKIILKNGSKGNVVSWVQCRVSASVDGKFGNETANKVKQFQQKYKLVCDGIVGINTFKKLLEVYNW